MGPRGKPHWLKIQYTYERYRRREQPTNGQTSKAQNEYQSQKEDLAEMATGKHEGATRRLSPNAVIPFSQTRVLERGSPMALPDEFGNRVLVRDTLVSVPLMHSIPNSIHMASM